MTKADIGTLGDCLLNLVPLIHRLPDPGLHCRDSSPGIHRHGPRHFLTLPANLNNQVVIYKAATGVAGHHWEPIWVLKQISWVILAAIVLAESIDALTKEGEGLFW